MQKTPIINAMCRRAHAEALAVAAAHGVKLEDSPDVRYGPKRVYFDHRPSILQDYDLGRPMEVEAIVRTPVALRAVPACRPRRSMRSRRWSFPWQGSEGLYAS